MKSMMRCAHEFRNALVYAIEFDSYSIVNCDGWVALNGFPHGCCGIASDLLGAYLLESGLNKVKVIEVNLAGENIYGVKSHVWLEVENKYVDITASQFPKLSFDRVLVQRKCRPESLFSLVDMAKADFDGYRKREPCLEKNMDVYAVIKQRIEKKV